MKKGDRLQWRVVESMQQLVVIETDSAVSLEAMLETRRKSVSRSIVIVREPAMAD